MNKEFKIVDGKVVHIEFGLTYMNQEPYSTIEQAIKAMPVKKIKPKPDKTEEEYGWMSEEFQRGIVGAMNYCHRHRNDCKHGKSPKLCWKCFRILIKKILLKIRLNNDFRKNSTKN